MREKIIGIYSIKNNIDNKIYIGQSIDVINRFYRHKSMLRRNVHFSPYFQNAFNKYGMENFLFEIEESILPENYSVAFLTKREKYWLDYYSSLLGRDNIYNIKDPEDPTYMTEETKKKLSDFFLKKSPEDIDLTNYIFELRVSKLTYKKIADKVGLSSTHIKNILDGKKRKYDEKEYQKNFEKVKNIKIDTSGKNHYKAKTSKEEQLEVDEIFDLRAQGLMYKQIAEITGYCDSHVLNIISGKKRNHDEEAFLKNQEKLKNVEKIMSNGLTESQYKEK